ncbi:flagellum-specific ATP synthase [Dongia mobilis]|uniref:Flagellum-specific ATP synthase n=1 Tax=Dongia mobilis TaxID=578943 RepID=A0A4R6WWC0_9PROT|nr:flagellar protein export ATPase FliI [Dongia mobilis]TDQ84344.1 flagellum-specific ATP synthase [Dongia mobilis]
MIQGLEPFFHELDRIPDIGMHGRVAAVVGMLVEIVGIEGALAIGARCALVDRNQRRVPCEVVGFREGRALAMTYGSLEGVGLGSKVVLVDSEPVVRPSRAWLGRVINAFGEPIDGKGPLPSGAEPCRIRNQPPPAHARARVGAKIDLGIRSINAFASVCRGQRLGIFAASGIGKSVLMSMMARYASLDVNVIGLIGERGREVQEFIEDELGPEGLARSVVVVATSDESPLLRRQAAQVTMALAEFFRDEGLHVLCLMDSVTRFAMAMREIGLSVGEPPASKGYTPSVFAELPRLLERAGPGVAGSGSITGLFTVLVEGDDHNEPIADACRGILDGHIVLERSIAERGRYPAVNILRSLSRTMPGCNTDYENRVVREARRHMSVYDDMAELIRLGAYRRGTDPAVDQAIQLYPQIEAFLAQGRDEKADLELGYLQLAAILGIGPEEPAAPQPAAMAPPSATDEGDTAA